MDLTSYLPPVLALVGVLIVLIALMGLGWRLRARRQSDLPEPRAVGADERSLRGDLEADGTYVSTTHAGQHLERVTAHGLGTRSRVRLVHTAGEGGTDPAWTVLRQGERSFEIPVAGVTAVMTAPGMVGKWIGGDGLLVLRWRLGETLLDTGFRLDTRADHDALLARGLEDLGPAAPAGDLRADDPATADPAAGSAPASPQHPAPTDTPPAPQPRKELP